jgi:hypothetical protein
MLSSTLRGVWAAALCVLPLWCAPGHAQTAPAAGVQPRLFGYVDGAGMAHFASSALDSRYAPVLRAQQDERLRDPRANIMAGARMLADLDRRLGGIDVALAAWNAGEGKVRRAGGKVPAIAETQAHVHLVLELYWALLQQRQHRQAKDMNLVPSDPLQPVALR